MKHAPMIVTALLLFAAPACADTDAWIVEANPYRVRLKLSQPLSIRAALNVDAQTIIDTVAGVAVDQVNHDTLAFEKTVLINPRSGNVVGRFQLVPVGPPLEIDGSFAGLRSGTSPWLGFNANKMSFENVMLDGRRHQALMIEEETITNAHVIQDIDLEPGARYLLEYWIMMDPVDNEMNVMVRDPNLRIFAHAPHSYYNKLPPAGKWARRAVLFRPRTPAGDKGPVLEVTHAFVGRGGVADLRMRQVEWRLIVEPDQPLDTLDVYALARAGHRLTEPTDELVLAALPRLIARAQVVEADVQPLNPDSVMAVSGDAAAWTIEPQLPLKVGAIRNYAPADGQGASVARVDVFAGGSASLVIAVDAKSPRLDDVQASCDLPADVTFHRLATIPVYSGATVNGEVQGDLIETRYDAMVPLDYALDPDSADGIHVIVATVTPDQRTTPGVHRGELNLRFADRDIVLPVELGMSSLTIKAKEHFGSIIGLSSFFLTPRKGVADMADDGTSMAEYHGLTADRTTQAQGARPILERYLHFMLDNHMQPQSPALGIWPYVSYRVVDRGESLAPQLTDWTFTQAYDDAIRTFVIDRESPWILIGRSNGHLMDKLWLNGTTYSVNANPDGPKWVQLPREQFDQLVGEYWDAMARHMDELGILDRTVFVVDESQESTYDDILAYVRAMRAQPYASQIKIGHTIQKVSTWTRKLPDGTLMMDEVLDMPMPGNDEHYNFFEHEWNARMTRPKIQWVYHVETDHINLENAGLSSAFLPLKCENLGVDGWYIWDICIWSLPYAHYPGKYGSNKYPTGPVINPWVNPFYHHGPGVLSFFYPPDPRGPAPEATDLIIPSYRLTLYRDGVQVRALLEAMRAGRDDAGRAFDVDAEQLAQVQSQLARLWPSNPVQWYLDYSDYHRARRTLYRMAVSAR